MMTQDKGWWKAVLLLALALLVPVVGWLGVIGYAYEWARLTAWGVDSAPKQKGVKVGACIAAGWRVFVVMLGLGIVLGIAVFIVQSILDAIFGYGILDFLVRLVVLALQIAGGLFISVAALRAVIYQKIGPGYGLGQVWKMYRHDFPGLLRIFVIELIGAAAAALVGLIFSAIAFSWILNSLSPMLVNLGFGYGYGYGYGADYYIMQAIMSAASAAGPILIVFLYVSNLVGVMFGLLATNALGLWMRQYDVPNWGDSHEELPEPIDAGPAPQGDAPTPVNPAAPVAAAPVVPVAPAVKQEAREEGTVEYPNEDVNAGKVSDLHPTAPAEKDIYHDAADAITEWTSVVEPENPVDHIPYKEVATEKPVEQGTDGFPTQRDSYTVAAGNVAAWPEVDLEATNALEEKKIADEMAGAEPQVFDDPETVPTEKDIYHDAADAITDWTSVVEPENATDHIPYKEVATEKPVEQGTDGFPMQEDIYGEASRNVAAWPENSLDDSKVVAEEQLVEDDVKLDKPDDAKSE
jgi:hypothetical protein